MDDKDTMRYSILHERACAMFIPCKEIESYVMSIRDEETQAVGFVRKVRRKVCPSVCVPSFDYSVRFPAGASENWKIMILLGVQLIDFIYWELYC